jgi:hypothetical protein
MRTGKEIITYFGPDGRPCLELTGKNGKKRSPRKTDVGSFGLVRNVEKLDDYETNTTLRDARILGLYPSVTNVNSVIKSPGLDSYKDEQMFLACVTTPRPSNFSDEEFAEICRLEANQHRKDAADLGTDCHILLSDIGGQLKATGKLVGEHIAHDLWPYVNEWIQYAIDHKVKIIEVEKTVVSPLGYAGTIDLIAEINGRIMLIDFKTRNCKGKKPVVYRQQVKQLAAYAAAYNKPVTCANVFLDTDPNNIGAMTIKEFEPDTISRAYDAFLDTFAVWQDENRFNPIDKEQVF